ncbi:ABC transporter permease [uncultured Amnibacterium sp.]|uniref:ABC transporter permease n=1 Tax=uncultured Amnibacterium sp. TaxID=1631851 RepID=UPI0035C99B13
MGLYIARRLAFAIVTVLAAVLISFLLVHAAGGSPGAVVLGPSGTAAEIAAKNRELGWDRPLPVQFLDYLAHLVRGDLGTSLIDGHSIADDMAARLPVTGAIALFATILSGVLGVLLGVTAAVRGGRVSRLINAGSGVVLSLPPFWVGILLVFVFAIQLAVLPATGYVAFTDDVGGWAASLVLPVAALTLGGAAIIARTACAGMRAALNQEHIRTLRALGTATWRIRYIHALRLASLPVVSVLGIQFISLFGGSVIVETLFALPGLGQASQAAVSSHDFPSLIAVVIVATVVVVVINLLLDLVIAALDPKLRNA